MQELIDFLRGCPEGFSDTSGLCHNIKCEFEWDVDTIRVFNKALRVVLPKWKYYKQGAEFFVIKHPTMAAYDAYSKAVDKHAMYTGEYGRRRIELANLIADELEKQLCKS